ncbi:winged helix-turn-helix domain-containing protein, partial [Ramlibacter aquaticus]|uniref:winged helix-turn-helix domain-containing protein n=1 Tax=Ramlibacter aquaticus TaxID=2780094 RepID=UPI002AB21C16
MTPKKQAAPQNARASGALIHRIFNEYRGRIESRALAVGERLPSVRAMAASMSISNETGLRAYDKLAAAGYLEARRGSGFYVSPRALEVGAPTPSPRWEGPPSPGSWDHLLQSTGPEGDSA